jgi:hypothetical protein
MAQPGLAPDINLLEAMDIFKNFPDEELPKYRNDPKLALVAAAEMDRRLRIRKDFEAKQQKPSGPIIDQLQQQLMAPPMQQPMGQPMQPMGQPMQQPMEQPMAQPEMQQRGLGSLVPGMAQGGPVAFQFGGGVGAEFGGSSDDALAADEERRQRLIRDRKLQEDRQRYEFLVNAGATQQAQQLAQQNPEAAKPAPVAGAKPAEQKPADQTQGQNTQLNDLIRQLIAQRGQQQQPAAAAPVDLKGLEKLAKEYMPAQVPVMSVEERRKAAEEQEKYLQKKFPDTVSPMAERLAAELGQQVSPEEARRRAFMKAGIAGLGYQGRDFGGGLAGMLEGYEGTRQSIEDANKEAKTLALKARLANEQYKDAIKRKDYESATKYADEVAQIKAAQVDAQNKAKLGKLGVMGAMQDLMTPKRVPGSGTGAASQKGALTEDQYIRAKERALERAQPKLAELDKEFDKRSKQWFGANKLPADWKQDKDAMQEYTTRKKRIIDEAFEEVQRPAVLDLTNPEILKKILQLTPNK